MHAQVEKQSFAWLCFSFVCIFLAATMLPSLAVGVLSFSSQSLDGSLETLHYLAAKMLPSFAISMFEIANNSLASERQGGFETTQN